MRALIAKFPDILGVIPMNNIDLMAATLLERFNISTMTAAMTLTLTEEEAEDDDEESSVWRLSRCRRRSCQVSRNSGSGTFQGMYEIR